MCKEERGKKEMISNLNEDRLLNVPKSQNFPTDTALALRITIYSWGPLSKELFMLFFPLASVHNLIVTEHYEFP